LFTYGNIYSLTQKDNSFDLVIACEILEHLHEPEINTGGDWETLPAIYTTGVKKDLQDY